VSLDELIAGLEIGATAPSTGISIVLGSSVCPVPTSNTTTTTTPSSRTHPACRRRRTPSKVKAYKYTGNDEILDDLAAKVQKDRCVDHPQVRSARFTSARSRPAAACYGLADGGDRSTTGPPLVAVATDRATFEAIDLANVVPQATLGHLGAVISKNPHGLVAIDTSKGIRGK
jgi:restriction system protein